MRYLGLLIIASILLALTLINTAAVGSCRSQIYAGPVAWQTFK